MQIAYTSEQEALRGELRAYFSKLMTDEVQRELGTGEGEGGTLYRDLVRQMGKDGWLGIGWPTEYGGQNRSMIEQLIFTDEASKHRAPVPFLTINTVGPTIMQYGSDEQKRFFLPKILAGEMHFSIGYSEPDAGTDLAALRTRAERDGDEYVINGQKMWTSLIEWADYVWLAVRTDPDAPRHKGLSVFLVPTDTPGFSWSPVPTVTGATTSQTFYEDVRVPAGALVGDENGGWRLITGQLNRERVALCSAASVQQSLEEVRRWAQDTRLADGRRVIDQEWVRINLGRVHAKVEFLKLINWKIAWGVDKGVSPADASATKVFGTEFYTEAYRLLMECIGEDAYVTGDSPGAVIAGRLERAYRGALILTFGGGTNEIQRDIISMVALGMPRAPASEKESDVDFSFTEDQEQIADLTRRILADKVTVDTLRASESGTDRFDPDLWRTLAEAGIVGIALPASMGGGGFGIIEQCLVLEEVGRRIAPVPILASVVLGAAPIAAFGTPAQHERWVRPAAEGTVILTAALREPTNADPSRPRTTAARRGEGYVLNGVKTAVPAAPLADLVLVPAEIEGSVGVFAVETSAPGVTVERQRTTNRDVAGRLVLDDVQVDDAAVLGSIGDGPAIVQWMDERAVIGLCALQLGTLEEALADTAEYTKTRVQFQRPIATFQAVGHRCADGYIDVEGCRLTLWQAAWRLSEGLDASVEVEVAKFWAAEAGHRVAHSAVHLHGGMGVANEHTIHRYFIAAKQNEFMLGGATEQLLRIGDALASMPA